MGYKIKVALCSFILSFVLLFPIGVFLAIDFITSFDYKVKSVDNRFKFLIPKEQDMNILFVNYSNIEGRNIAEVFVLIKISAYDNSVTLMNIPSNLRTIMQNKLMSLQECFEYSGIGCVKKVLESFLNIPIDRTIQADDFAVKSIVNCVKGIKLEEKDVLNLGLNLPIVDGKRVVGGEQFCYMLKNNPVRALSLLKYNFFNSVNLNRLFADIASIFKTNISEYDFDIRKKGFEEMINSKHVSLNIQKLELNKIKGRHILTDFSKQNCEQIFKK